MRIRLFFLPVLVFLGGCLLGLPLEEPFECEGTCVGDLEVSLPDGRLYDGPLPQPTSHGDEPVITGSRWVAVDNNTTGLEIQAQSGAAITAVYLEIDGEVYVFDPVVLEGGPAPDAIDACDIVAEQQGYSCTEACVEACSCVECDDSYMQSNLSSSCAASCSIYAHQGLIGPDQEPYSSEVVFADIIYNGYSFDGESVPGMLESLPGCYGSVCRDRAQEQQAAESRRVRVDFYHQDWSFLKDLNTGAMVVESQPEPSRPSISQPASPARLVNEPDCPVPGCRT